jgi:hypothetical protein
MLTGSALRLQYCIVRTFTNLMNPSNIRRYLFTTQAGAQLLYQVIMTSWAGEAAFQQLLTVHRLLQSVCRTRLLGSFKRAGQGMAAALPQSVVLVGAAAAAHPALALAALLLLLAAAAAQG